MKTTVPEFQKLATEIHTLDNHKWWHTKEGQRLERVKGELLMLIVSELAEAMEGERKNKMDDKLTHRKMAEVEMADVVIRLLDYMAGFDIPITWDTSILFSDNRAECLLRITGLVYRSYIESLNGFRYSESIYLSKILYSCYGYCEKFGYDLDGAMEEKRAFNRVRPDHTYAAREADGGKAF